MQNCNIMELVYNKYNSPIITMANQSKEIKSEAELYQYASTLFPRKAENMWEMRGALTDALYALSHGRTVKPNDVRLQLAELLSAEEDEDQWNAVETEREITPPPQVRGRIGVDISEDPLDVIRRMREENEDNED